MMVLKPRIKDSKYFLRQPMRIGYFQKSGDLQQMPLPATHNI